MFDHIDINLPKLERETIDGVRYYSVPEEDELIKLVSITSITSGSSKASPRLTTVVTKALCPESSRAVTGVDTQWNI